ncbi:MAG: glucose-1-phosphate adenylyltransferase [Erysipelotrichales bacterium]|nr:glucose-1-phosphate adenylyltransferase [Erysipelotrichales bacterium]MBQ1387133.1 glucose-1-phosphate adenylyltransferase [Erysipelotrichales bacterium]MBQ2309836.1 glucose-1-phosphate adenylyltransferase [Erysipelotrichales bacterium]MBQ4011744.1 glucose-1-phosphate adenylyltransferase [Erysipelotrichales bacterium]MBQ4375034.1 glucose-1-phosphate adenylyltransferase [Erysipelotrichales bacterium]
MRSNMLAMILAGGRGSRLKELTSNVAKPAVYFGGKYRIIDFPLSNCANSNVDVVGVLTQYESVLLNSYCAQDQRWGLDTKDGGVFILPPREKDSGFGLYRGTADAITQNIDFVDHYNPEYVLILSGDHIYKMDYAKMLEDHKKNNADLTIAVMPVPMKEASRFGIMVTDKTGRITKFEEKPKKPSSNLASMGIYIFNWKLLRERLLADMETESSSHDFGKDIIPGLMSEGKRVFAWNFTGYWKDVGTVDSLWEANMDLLDPKSTLDLSDPSWKIYTQDIATTPQFIGENASVEHSFINQGCIIDGSVSGSVFFHDVRVKEDAVVKDSVLFPGVVVEPGAKVVRAILGENVVVKANETVGSEEGEITLVTKGEDHE